MIDVEPKYVISKLSITVVYDLILILAKIILATYSPTRRCKLQVNTVRGFMVVIYLEGFMKRYIENVV